MSKRNIKLYLSENNGAVRIVIHDTNSKYNIIFDNHANFKIFTGELQGNSPPAGSTARPTSPSSATSIKWMKDFYAFLGIYQISKNQNYAIFVNQSQNLGQIPHRNLGIYAIGEVTAVCLDAKNINHKSQMLHKILEFLNSGTFYYTDQGTATVAGQPLASSSSSPNSSVSNWELCNSSMFLWNRLFLSRFLHEQEGNQISFLQPELNLLCTRIINGSVRLKQIYVGAENVTCLLISRLSLNRVGTRYKTRGIDDYGNVANFVETNQTIFYGSGKISNFTQIRGSIPVYWAQPGTNVGAHKIYFTRKNPLDIKDCQVNMMAVKDHFNLLEKLYPNKKFVALNLVKQTPGGEKVLSDEYQQCLVNEQSRVLLINFDLHAQKNRDSAMETLLDNRPEIVDFHRVIVRTNCIDCLDRTNGAQKIIGLRVLLQNQLPSLEIDKNRFMSFVAEYKKMWVENGDNLSMIYAGTAAMGTGSKFVELSKSVTRTVKNNWMDGDKEKVMKTLAGQQSENRFSPLNRILLQNSYALTDTDKMALFGGDERIFDSYEHFSGQNASLFFNPCFIEPKLA